MKPPQIEAHGESKATPRKLPLKEQAVYAVLAAGAITWGLFSSDTGLPALVFAVVAGTWQVRRGSGRLGRLGRTRKYWGTVPERSSSQFVTFVWKQMAIDFPAPWRASPVNPHNHASLFLDRPQWAKWQEILDRLSEPELRALAQIASFNQDAVRSNHALIGVSVGAAITAAGLVGIKLQINLDALAAATFVLLVPPAVIWSGQVRGEVAALNACAQVALAEASGTNRPPLEMGSLLAPVYKRPLGALAVFALFVVWALAMFVLSDVQYHVSNLLSR